MLQINDKHFHLLIKANNSIGNNYSNRCLTILNLQCSKINFMLIVVAVLILVLGIILIGKIILSRQFKREVRILFAQSKNISSQIHSKI